MDLVDERVGFLVFLDFDRLIYDNLREESKNIIDSNAFNLIKKTVINSSFMNIFKSLDQLNRQTPQASWQSYMYIYTGKARIDRSHNLFPSSKKIWFSFT